jgi:hypothetical protein
MVTTPGFSLLFEWTKSYHFSLLEDLRKSTGKHNRWATRQRTSFSSTEGAQERLYIKLRGGHEWVPIYR